MKIETCLICQQTLEDHDDMVCDAVRAVLGKRQKQETRP